MSANSNIALPKLSVVLTADDERILREWLHEHALRVAQMNYERGYENGYRCGHTDPYKESMGR
jgi:hypothetical protein